MRNRTILCDICGNEAPAISATCGELKCRHYGGRLLMTFNICYKCAKLNGVPLLIARQCMPFTSGGTQGEQGRKNE